MSETADKMKQAEDMIRGELNLLLEGAKEGDELEIVAGSLRAVFSFAFSKSPIDILAINLIISVLSATILEITFTKLRGHSYGD